MSLSEYFSALFTTSLVSIIKLDSRNFKTNTGSNLEILRSTQQTSVFAKRVSRPIRFSIVLLDLYNCFLLIAGVEILAGIMILLNKYIALLLVILFPVMLNAFLFHLFLDIAGIWIAALAIFMNVFLLYTNKEKYKLVFDRIENE